MRVISNGVEDRFPPTDTGGVTVGKQYRMFGFAVLILMISHIAIGGDLEDRLSTYGKENAKGYLRPLVNAIGTDLNGGLFHSAKIPMLSFYASLEVHVVSVLFQDADRTFEATTEEGFSPRMKVTVPTVVGSGEAVAVEGDNGTSQAFPGGFELNSFALVVPQLRFGSVFGTEGLVRYFAWKSEDEELGKISYLGFGLRHCISRYLPPLPVDLAAGFFWQKLTLGKSSTDDDLLSAKAQSIGVVASKRFGRRFMFLEPYAGFSIDTFSMDVSYTSDDDEEEIDVDFGRTTTARLTMGLSARLGVLNAYADYNLAKQRSFSLGIGLGM